MAETTVPQLLAERALAEPGRVALAEVGGGALTYGEWDRGSGAVAQGLVDRGVHPGERIGLYFDNHRWVDYAVGYVGVLKAGAVAVPMSPRFAAREVAEIGATCALTGVVAMVGAPLPDGPWWRSGLSELTSGRSPDPVARTGSLDDLAEVLFTSGTTGTAKGVACTHRHLTAGMADNGARRPPEWPDVTGRVYLHANSLSTAGGQLRLLEPLSPTRMSTFALPVFDPDRMLAAIADLGATAVQLVPAMALAIADRATAGIHDTSSVRLVELGCAPAPAEAMSSIAAAFPDAVLVNVYELSETRHLGTHHLHDGAAPGSVGTPRGLTEVRIVAADGADAAPLDVGEVWLRHPLVPPQWYYGDPEATEEVFGSGWTRTGDAGYLDEQHRLHLVDRLKDLVLVGGVNVSSLAVENALVAHPAVREVAVVGLPDRHQGERVVAVVVAQGHVLDGELRRVVREALGPLSTPQEIVFVDSLPKNASGKPLKRELRTRLAAERPGRDPVGSSGGPAIEPRLRQVWDEVLGPAETGHEDLFERGGNSLTATQIASRARELFSVEVTTAMVLESRTLGELAASIGELVASQATVDQAIPRVVRTAPGTA